MYAKSPRGAAAKAAAAAAADKAAKTKTGAEGGVNPHPKDPQAVVLDSGRQYVAQGTRPGGLPSGPAAAPTGKAVIKLQENERYSGERVR